MITTPTFMFYLSDIMQSYALHTHNVVLFLVSSWKQTFRVRKVVSVEDRTWENIDLSFISLWVWHSILITSTFGNFYDDSLHLGIIKLFFKEWKYKKNYLPLIPKKFFNKRSDWKVMHWRSEGRPWTLVFMIMETM